MFGRKGGSGAVALLALSAVSLQAQTAAPPVQLDSRIRVASRSDPGLEAVGALSSWTDESLQVARSGVAPISIPLSDVASLEVSRGTKRHTLVGMAAGAGLGLVVGLVAANNEREPDSMTGSAQEWETATDARIVAFTTVLGTGIGALVGALIKTEKWDRVEGPGAGGLDLE